MNLLEHAPTHQESPDFGTAFSVDDFDINAAFQDAIQEVASDDELALEDKIRRMEVIVGEGTSEVYRSFVDFRAMAAHMEMICNHDHTFGQSMHGSEALSSFMSSHKADDGHNHAGIASESSSDDDDDETDPKTGKKKKKRRRGWLAMLIK